MAGSVANPVSLDPFRTITEVHWNNATHICFYIMVTRDTSTTVTTFDPPPDPGFGLRHELPYEEYTYYYIDIRTDVYTPVAGYVSTTISYGYDGGAVINSPFTYRSGSWSGVSGSEVSIDGGLPAVTTSGTWSTSETSWTDYPAFTAAHNDGEIWKTETGGSGAGISVPSGSSLLFDESTSPRFLRENNMMASGDPEWVSNGPFFAFSQPYSSGVTTIYNEVFPASSIVARYKGKAYRCIATKYQKNLGGYVNRMWILCARSPSDD